MPRLVAMTGEQFVEINPDHAFERHEARRLVLVGQPHETLQLRGHRQKAVTSLGIAPARQAQRHREAEIGNERKRVRRIDGKRGQHGKNLLAEFLVQPFAIGRQKFVRVDHRDTGRAQIGTQFDPDGLLVGDELACDLFHLRKLLGGGQPIGAGGGDACAAPCPSGPRRGPCRIHRGSRPKSTGTAPAQAADGAGSGPLPPRGG